MITVIISKSTFPVPACLNLSNKSAVIQVKFLPVQKTSAWIFKSGCEPFKCLFDYMWSTEREPISVCSLCTAGITRTHTHTHCCFGSSLYPFTYHSSLPAAAAPKSKIKPDLPLLPPSSFPPSASHTVDSTNKPFVVKAKNPSKTERKVDLHHTQSQGNLILNGLYLCVCVYLLLHHENTSRMLQYNPVTLIVHKITHQTS